ncbi:MULTISPECIES: hypothetical protein [unclassified Flavobacterium]|jgi:hypothetical protein|uniref:hypothetical protein n=1 Tax=unclassified Flavobacterium TaxID=196869 RepID=UPI0025BA2AA0|nr:MULTISPECIES: hypothetical protein [unclassified Flavobacterium]
MIEIIDFLFPILGIIGIISFSVFVILGVAYKLHNNESNVLNYLEENIYFRISAILIIISFVSIFGLNSYVNKLSRTEITKKIEKINNSDFTLYINDSIRKNDSLIIALKKIKQQTSGRNTGSKEINIKLKTKSEIIDLKLLRDFTSKTKYWVFYSKYQTTSKNCIGEINTNCLNDCK